MNKFFKKLKNVSIKDIGHIFLFMIAWIPARILKRRRKNMWLVCEYGKEARDNGYWLYRYICEQHPCQDVVYAIDKSAKDYLKVKDLGEVISYGGLKHWIYYLAAEVNISSHKGGKPNAAVCYLLEIYGLLKNKRVFLQHGITKDMVDTFTYPNTKMRLFVCGAKPEYEFVRDTFGYPKDYVVYTGFSRFDYLLKPYPQKRQILAAPTWRSWLRTASSDPYLRGSNKEIEKSEYFKTWKHFLCSRELEELLEAYDMRLVFYPHRNVLDCFEQVHPQSERITVADWEAYDLQLLMKESMMMITDYSSAIMDFAYMQKPLLYYQFDYKVFREKHFSEGYFHYKRDGFGPVCEDFKSLMNGIRELLDHNCEMPEEYIRRLNQFFVLRDDHNCERIYQEICKL